MRFAKAHRLSKQGTDFLVPAAFSLFVAVVVVFWAIVRIDDVPAFSLALILLVLTILPFVIALARGRLELLEPIHILSFIVALYFAVRALYIVFDVNRTVSQVSYYFYQDTIPLALCYVILGYLSLLVGYHSSIPSRIVSALPPLTWQWPHSLSVGRVLLVYAIGLFSQMLLFQSTGSNIWTIGTAAGGVPSYYLLALSLFTQYATSMTAISIFGIGTRKIFVYLFWLLLVPTAIVQSFMWGGRHYLLAAVTTVLVAYHYLRRRLSTIQVAVYAIVIFASVFPVLAIYRGTYLGSVGRVSTLAELVEQVQGLAGYLSRLGWSEYVSFAADALMSRSHGIDSLSLIIKYTPGISDFKYGWEYLLIPLYAFIPRAIWPDKPLNPSINFGQVYIIDPAISAEGSIGQFHIGDLYWNFGLFGIMVGMLLLGIFYRTIYAYLAPAESKHPLRVFLYTFFLLQVMQAFEVDIVSMFSNLLKTLVFLIPVCWFMRKR